MLDDLGGFHFSVKTDRLLADINYQKRTIMPRLDPMPPESLSPDMQAVCESATANMGFLPNDLMLMARNPGLVAALGQLVGVVYGPGRVPPTLKRLVGLVCSSAAGCRYCTAHTGHGAHNVGVDPDKLDAVWDFERSDLFDHAERAALRVALGAGQNPNSVSDEQFEDLKRHFDPEEIVEIVAVIAMFGFLNRWNDTLAPELESVPFQFASQHLSAHGWEAGKHQPKEI